MAEKILNTRIQLKYDSYSAWEAVKDTFKPLKGEICIVNPGTNLSDATAVPCLAKVGDGEHFWRDLPWLSATAADVYAWGKAADVVFEEQHLKFKAANGTVIKDVDLSAFTTESEVNALIKTYVGDKANLTTAEKGTVVGAVNELDAEIGTLSGLDTTNKGNLVAAINEVRQAVEVGGTGSVVTVVKDGDNTYKVKQGENFVDVPIVINDADLTLTTGDGIVSANTTFGANEATAKSFNVAHAVPTGAAAGTKDGVTTDKFGHVTGVDLSTYATQTAVDALGLSAAEGELRTVGGGSLEGNAIFVNIDGADNGTNVGFKSKTDNVNISVSDYSDIYVDANKIIEIEVDGYTKTEVNELIQGAKDYADTNDANTEYHVEYDSTNKKIKLVAGADASKMEIPTDDFIKDGMINTVAIDEATQELVITWNTDAGKEATKIKLSELADIYTGVDGTTINVTVSADDKIGAEVKTGSLTDGHIAANAAIAKTKLASDVQASLAKADTALQSHQDISGKKDKQTAVTNKITDAAHVLATLSQNANGEISYTVKTLTPADIGAEVADAANSLKTSLENGTITVNQATNADYASKDDEGNIIKSTYATKGELTTAIENLDSSVAATAESANQVSVLTGVTQTDGKLTAKTEVKLAAIAKTGNVNDLIQTSGDILVFNCGSSTVNV